jgi:hypothetical protein
LAGLWLVTCDGWTMGKWIAGLVGGVLGYAIAASTDLIEPATGGVGQDATRGYQVAIAFAVGALVFGFGYSVVFGTRRPERERQLVGQVCVFCKKQITWVKDSEFCASCGAPMHLSCKRPPQDDASVSDSTNPFVGLDEPGGGVPPRPTDRCALCGRVHKRARFV